MSALARAARETMKAYTAWSRAEMRGAVAANRKRVRHPTPNGRRVVLIAATFPPVVTGGTYRPLALARYGAQLGWEISVVGSEPSTATAAGRYLLQQVPSEVRVVRSPFGRALPSAKGLPQIDGTFAGALDLYARARHAIGAGGADFVVASGPPFNQFVAAFYLARERGSRLVLDYRDEWTRCPFDFVVSGRTDSWWEHRCIRAADLVLFTTPSQLERQLDAFPALERERCAVVPNGWEPANGGDTPSRSTAPAAQITISYVGTFAPFTRPERFLATLEAMLRARPALKERLRLQFVGRKHPSVVAMLDRFAYPNMLESIDELPMHEATGIMRSASALLLFNPPELAQSRTGKIYEYLAARRPILVIGDGGEIATLVRQLDGGVILDPDDPDGLARVVDRLAGGTLSPPTGAKIEEWLAGHTRRATAARFFSLLEALRSPGQTEAGTATPAASR